MMKYLKLGIVILGLFLINIIPVSAEDDYTKLNLSVDCSEPSTNCEITSDKFSYKIKKVKLTDGNGTTLSEISDFTINPEAYYATQNEDGNNYEISALKLNLNIPNLDNLLNDKDDSFNGFINIEYEANLLNAYNYNYKMDGLEGLFAILGAALEGLEDNVDQSELEKIFVKVDMPVSSNYNHYYVTIKNKKVNISSVKENDASSDNFSMPLMHFLFSVDNELLLTTPEEKVNGKFLIITDVESTDEDIIADGKYFDDMINNNSNTTTTDTANPKENSTNNPKTAIISNILIIILLILSIGLLLTANKKVLKKRI